MWHTTPRFCGKSISEESTGPANFDCQTVLLNKSAACHAQAGSAKNKRRDRNGRALSRFCNNFSQSLLGKDDYVVVLAIFCLVMLLVCNRLSVLGQRYVFGES